MKSPCRLLSILTLLFIANLVYAQVNYTANDIIIPYQGYYHPGINPGYYGANWDDNTLADIAAGNNAAKVDGIGVKALRGALPEGIGQTFTYDIWIDKYDYNEAVGTSDNLLFLGFASEEHKDKTDYCPEDDFQTDMFANLYEPIWDNGENGTPVNDENYYALYVWEVVSRLKGKVKFWEIWNEPGFDFTGARGWLPPGQPGNWWENNPDPCDYKLRAPIFHYIRTLRISYEVIKSLDPESYVVVAGVGFDSFLDALLRNTDNPDNGQVTPEYPLGAGAYFDVIGFHAYPHIDGSTKYWDNDLQQLVYTRHSDSAADALKTRRDDRQALLAQYGYDGTTYPKKEWIATEVNVPRIPTTENWGSDEVQRNYVMKVMMKAMELDFTQLHFYILGDWKPEAEATSEFDLMGMYKSLTEITPGQEQLNDAGIAHKTISDELYESRFDQARTDAMNLPANVGGGAYLKKNGFYTYALWAKTETDLSEEAFATYTFPQEWGLTAMFRKEWNYSQTGDKFGSVSGNIALTGSPAFFTVLEEDQDIFLNASCEMGVEIQVTATTPEGGNIVNWEEPTAQTNCFTGVTVQQTKGPANGSFFSFGVHEIQYTITNGCGDVEYCAFNVKVASTGGGIGDCNLYRWEMGFVGQYKDNKYFVSKVKKDFTSAQAQCASHGGYLVSIDSPEENEFLRQQINDLAFTGYNDVEVEGQLGWTSGKDVVYTNIANCEGCQNSEVGDATMFNHFNGEWYFVPASAEEYFIMELPCGELEDCLCTAEYDPVCGVDGVSYSNSCIAECEGVFEYTQGECSDTCSLEVQTWLAEKINGVDCDSGVGSLESFEFQGQSYVLEYDYPGVELDGGWRIYNCDGSLLCTENPFVGQNDCSDIFGPTNNLTTTILWSREGNCSDCNCPAEFDPVCGSNGITYSNSCFAECEGIFEYTSGACTDTCTLEDQEWYMDLLASVNCDDLCSVSIETFVHNDSTFVIFDNSTCFDLGFTIFDCEGNFICVGYGSANQVGCNDYFGEGFRDSTEIVWSRELECEDCICTTEVDPVCSPDGVTYGNPCLAECEGIFDYTMGACVESCLTINEIWLQNYLEGLDCDGCILSVESFVFNDSIFVVAYEDETRCDDAGIVVFDCNGDVYCYEGGKLADSTCLVYFGDYTEVDPQILWSKESNCVEPCNLEDQEWYADLISGLSCDEDFCTISVETFTYNDSTFVLHDIGLCPDGGFSVYDCEGDFICLEYGFAGQPGCTNYFGEGFRDSTQVIWSREDCPDCACDDVYDPVCGSDGVTYSNSCFAECEGIFEYTMGECSDTCQLETQTWLGEVLSELDCDSGVSSLESFEFQGQSYVVVYDFPGIEADGGWRIFNCDGTLLCSENPFGGQTECTDFFGPINSIETNILWSRGENCDDCNCIALYDPVCGSDGVTYSNSCFAECEGIFEYTMGECNESCLTINENWLQEYLEVLDCDGCIASVESFVFNDSVYIVAYEDFDFCADVGTTIYDCNGELFCFEGSKLPGTPCLDYFGDYTAFDSEILWSKDSLCVEPCNLDEQDWLADLLADTTLCNSCVATIEVAEFEGVTYIGVLEDGDNCSDALITVFNCDGTIYCYEGGEPGWTQCSELFGDDFEPEVTVLWDSDEECVDDCELENQEWLSNTIANLDCESCVSSLQAFEFNGSSFVVEFPDEELCADGTIVVYNCEGEVFCTEGGLLGLTECSEFFGEDFEPEVIILWSKEENCTEEPCILEDPEWLDELLANPSLCTSCTKQIDTYTYNDSTFVVVFGDPEQCSDHIDLVYDCNGVEYCRDGSIAGLNECEDFFTNAIFEENLWSFDSCIGNSAASLYLGDVTLYPNPTSDILNIEFDNVENESFKFTIINVAGQVYEVKETDLVGRSKMTFETQGLASGIYFIKVENAQGDFQMLRFVKTQKQ